MYATLFPQEQTADYLRILAEEEGATDVTFGPTDVLNQSYEVPTFEESRQDDSVSKLQALSDSVTTMGQGPSSHKIQ